MSICSSAVVQSPTAVEPASDEAFEHFKSRRRIVLHEADPALRSAITRCLIRLGCVVIFKRSPDDVRAILQEADYLHGAITCVDGDPTTAAQQSARLRSANRRQVPLVLLTDWPVGPDQQLEWRRASLTVLPKPFDTRDLLASLDLHA